MYVLVTYEYAYTWMCTWLCLMVHIWVQIVRACPDSKVHEANMGPIWGWQDPGGPHVGPMNFAI